jgi:hypothetical protein
VKELPFELASLFLQGRRSTTIGPAALGLVLAGAALAISRRLPRRAALAHTCELPRGAAWGHAALWAAVGTLLSLPPQVKLLGRSLVGPQTLLDRWTPFYEVVRAPSRLGVAGLMGLCLLAGLGHAEIAGALARRFDRRNGRVVQAALAAMALAILYWIPPGGTSPLPASFPVLPTPEVPAAFQPILDRGRGSLVELPALYPDGSKPLPRHAAAMFRSISHWRPILNGYSSYWPAGFIDRMRLAEGLPNRGALTVLARRYGVGLIWVDVRAYPPAKRRQWARASRNEGDGLALLAATDGQMLFAVRSSDLEKEAEPPPNPAPRAARRSARGAETEPPARARARPPRSATSRARRSRSPAAAAPAGCTGDRPHGRRGGRGRGDRVPTRGGACAARARRRVPRTGSA